MITKGCGAALFNILLMTIGVFGPWAKSPFWTENGLDGSAPGIAVLVVALLAATTTFAYYRKPLRITGVIIVSLAIWAIYATVHAYNDVTSFINDHSIGDYTLVSIGWGLNLTLTTSVALLVVGLYMTYKGRNRNRDEIKYYFFNSKNKE